MGEENRKARYVLETMKKESENLMRKNREL